MERLIRRDRWKRRLANASIFGAIGAPVNVFSAMMQPTIPFFIILNTPLELMVVPCAIFATWHNRARRRLNDCRVCR